MTVCSSPRRFLVCCLQLFIMLHSRYAHSFAKKSTTIKLYITPFLKRRQFYIFTILFYFFLRHSTAFYIHHLFEERKKESHAPMTRMYRRAWALLRLLLLAVPHSLAIPHQRCRSIGNINNSSNTKDVLQTFVPSSCEVCTYEESSSFMPKDETRWLQQQQQQQHEHGRERKSLHIAILLPTTSEPYDTTTTTTATMETMLIMAAGLLTRGHRITLLHSFEPTMVRDLLFQTIPCPDQIKARSLLTIRTIMDPSLLCKNTYSSNQDQHDSIHPKHGCDMENAASLTQALQTELTSSSDILPLDLLLTDGMFVAGMLVAELLVPPLPTLVVVMEGDEPWGRRLSFGNRNDDDDSWSFLAWDRWHILDHPWKEYIALNRLRHMLGLRRLRTWSEFWTQNNRLLLMITASFHSPADVLPPQSIRPNLLRIPMPLLPPCVPCSTNSSSSSMEKKNPNSKLDSSTPSPPALAIAVTFSNTSQGRIASRTLLQALSMARASLEEMSMTVTQTAMSNVAQDDLDSSEHAWTGPSDFVVVRLGDALEELQPPFVTTTIEDPHYFVDYLVRHMPVIGIVTQCTGGADTNRLFLSNRITGPPVLCMERHSSPRELATAILNLMGGKRKDADSAEHKASATTDGLVWFLALIDELLLHSDGKTNGTRLNPDLSSFYPFAPSPPTVTWTGWIVQYLAWSILFSTMLYVYLKPILFHTFYSISSNKRNTRRSHIHRDNSSLPKMMTLLFDEFIERLPELDHVFAMWKEWFWRELTNIQTTSQRTSEEEQNNPSHPTAAKNKRRSNHKKKH